jgi:hypothetical protein
MSLEKNLSKNFFLKFAVLGLELRAFTFSHYTRPIFVKGCFEIRSQYFPRLALNLDPPDLCFLSS